jgi:hypothetical protein
MKSKQNPVKPSIQNGKHYEKQAAKPSQGVKNKIEVKTLFDRLDVFFNKHQQKFFWISLALSCLFGALLFDLKISEGADDSGYIVAAHDFINGKAFPTWHGSFYPILISLPMLIFGMKLFVFKALSYLLMAGQLVLLYLALKDKISATLLSIVLLLVAINSQILYHASSTYSEPLYFFLQALVVYFFILIIDKTAQKDISLYKHWKLWLAFGLSSFLLSITRNVGLGILITLIIYFVINRQFKEILYSVVAFLIFQIPYSLYKNLYWKLHDVGFESQFGEMFWKHPYDKSQGKEDMHGFIVRFLDNSDLYLSKHMFKILGLRSLDSMDKSVLLTLIVYVLFFVAFVYSLVKKNKYMQFISLYLAVAIGATFITQQTFWDQSRLILIYVPLILILFGYGILELSKSRKIKILQPLLLGVFIVIFFSSFKQTTNKVEINQPILEKNMGGDNLYGFTPDWVHYFQISEWAANNLPKEAVIACRKPSMSFIYSNGRDFFGIYKLPMLDPDTMLTKISKEGKEIALVAVAEFSKKPFPAAVFDSLRKDNRAMFVGNNSVYIAFSLSGEKKDYYKGLFDRAGIEYQTNIEAFRKMMKGSKEAFYAEDADLLLKYLDENHVHYIILATLRKFTQQKTEYFIDTIHRYLYFIQMKYPKLFRKIYQVGTENDEPASIIEIAS